MGGKMSGKHFNLKIWIILSICCITLFIVLQRDAAGNRQNFVPIDAQSLAPGTPLTMTSDKDCLWYSYYCGETYYYWPAADDSYGTAYSMRFSPEECCTLTQVGLRLFDDYPEFSNASEEGIDVKVWDDDGTGLPGTLIYSQNVPDGDLIFDSNFLYVDFSEANLVLCSDFHVGFTLTNPSIDNMAVLSDIGDCGSNRSSVFSEGMWIPASDFGIDPNFLISSKLCNAVLDYDSICCEIVPNPDCEKTPCTNITPVPEWSWSVPATILTGYDQVMMTPIVADLEDDGKPEVFFISFIDEDAGWASYPHVKHGGVLRILNGQNGNEILSFPTTDADLDNMFYGASQIAVGDIDGNDNGMMEILVTRRGTVPVVADRGKAGQGIYCVDVDDITGDGDYDDPGEVWIKWQSPHPSESILSSGISIADINQDGLAEVIVGSVVLNGQTGNLFAAGWAPPHADPSPGPGPFTTSFAADIKPGGDLEIVCGRTVYKSDGTVLWSLNGMGVDGAFAGVADFDGDTYAEVALVWSGNVSLIDCFPPDFDVPTITWTLPLPKGVRGGPPCIGECWSGSAGPEIGIAGDSMYYVVDAGGNLIDSWQTKDYSSGMTGSTMFDFEQDGVTEIIYNDEDTLRIYQAGQTNPVAPVIGNSTGTVLENPVVADVDNDGSAEFVVCANNISTAGGRHGIYVYGAQNNCWVNTRRIWNQHAYSITNVNDDGSIPQYRTSNWLSTSPTFNNFRRQMFWNENPNYLPDLCIHQLKSTLNPLCDGQGNTVMIATVANNGMANVPPGVEVAFYYSAPNDCTHTKLIGTAFTTAVIAPGQTVDVIFTDYYNCWPEWIKVEACVDDDGYGNGHIVECDENNNCCCKVLATGCRSSISGRKYEDLNLNCIYDPPNDKLLPNWYIGLYDYHRATQVLTYIDHRYTNSSGKYKFDCLKPLPYPSVYRVYEDFPTMPPSIWLQTCPDDGYYQVELDEDEHIGYFNFFNIHRDSIQCQEGGSAFRYISFCMDQYSKNTSFIMSNQFPSGCTSYRWYLVSEDIGSPDTWCNTTGLQFTPTAGVLDFGTYGSPIQVNFEIDRSGTLPSSTYGDHAGFAIVIRDDCTGDLYCFYGMTYILYKWCFPVPPHTPFDPNISVIVHNDDQTRETFHYRFRSALTSDDAPDPYVSLNSLPVGTPVEDSVDIAIGDSAIISVDVAFTEQRPGEIHQLILEYDTDDDGEFDPVMSTPIMSKICGDANSDAIVNVSDAVWIINYIFVGGDPPDPLSAGDVNCDGTCNVSDAVWIINYVFVGGYFPCDTDGDEVPDC
jgi:Dockerin type I domain/CARDB/FG-GAP-like repeat